MRSLPGGWDVHAHHFDVIWSGPVYIDLRYVHTIFTVTACDSHYVAKRYLQYLAVAQVPRSMGSTQKNVGVFSAESSIHYL